MIVRSSEQIQQEMEQSLGFVPPLFESVLDKPDILEPFWHQARHAWIQNPLPAHFKEMLIAYLSRYCSHPYLMICHSCSLFAMGMKGSEIYDMLTRLVPVSEEDETRLIAQLELIPPIHGQTWPAPLSTDDTVLFDAAVSVFLHRRNESDCNMQLTRILSPAGHMYLALLLTFIQACHYWTESWPPGAYKDDKRANDHLRQLMLAEPRLVELFKDYRTTVKAEGGRHSEDADEIRHVNDINLELRIRLKAVMEAIPDALIIFDDKGRIESINRVAIEAFGYSKQEVQKMNIFALIPTYFGDGQGKSIGDFLRDGDQLVAKSINCQAVRKDGSSFESRLLFTDLNLPNHPMFACVVQNISGQRQSEEALRAVIRRLNSALDSAQVGTWRWNLQEDTITWDDYNHALFGKTPGEFLGTPEDFYQCIMPRDRERVRDLIAESIDIGAPLDTEYFVLWPDGKTRVVATRGEVHRDARKIPMQITGVCWDITERKIAEQELEKANNKLAIWVKDLEERNHAMVLLNDLGEQLQVCLSSDEAFPAIANCAERLFPEDSGALFILKASKDYLEAVAVWGEDEIGEVVFGQEECWALRRGKIFEVERNQVKLVCHHASDLPHAPSLCIPMIAQGELMGMLYLRQGCNDQNWDTHKQLAANLADHVVLSLANLSLRESLRAQSIRDPLTGLFNRRYMQESLQRELRRAVRHRKQIGVMMIDVDHFKQFNDKFGHDAGDAALVAVANMFTQRLRGEDIVCRYGGEEFTVILCESGIDSCREKAEILLEEMRNTCLEHRGLSLGRITMSIGLAMFPDHGTTADELLRTADQALYKAKRSGRDRVVIADIPELGVGT